jgi:hypothetical protein
MEPLATYEDVQDRWRPLAPDEINRCTVLLDDASALLRAEFPGIDQTIATGGLDAAVVVAVVANITKRAMLAPADGISQESETSGPYSHSQSYANPMGNVFLTQAERTLILGYRPKAASNTFANATIKNGCAGQIVYGW